MGNLFRGLNLIHKIWAVTLLRGKKQYCAQKSSRSTWSCAQSNQTIFPRACSILHICRLRDLFSDQGGGGQGGGGQKLVCVIFVRTHGFVCFAIMRLYANGVR